MTEFKLVLGKKDGKSYQKEIKSPEADVLTGMKIGDKVSGDSIGFSGYEFEIRGGSDKCGFPMRLDVKGTQRRRLLTMKGMGVHIAREGQKIRKSFAGNTISESIAQINLKVLKEGAVPLGGASEENKPEESAA